MTATLRRPIPPFDPGATGFREQLEAEIARINAADEAAGMADWMDANLAEVFREIDEAEAAASAE